MRLLTYAAAIREALDIALSADPSVFVIGEGVPDPKGIFGTTVGLAEKYGTERVMDMPVSENGMTGVCIGAALSGMKPILIHQRADFSLYSFDQIVNAAAKWYAMFGGQKNIPLVIRMVVGRGWGQGAQHSQSLHALFAHIPGLKVVMPVTASDAKGLLLASIDDPNPVIFIEHRWLHELKGDVSRGWYTVPIGKAHIVQKGNDVTLVGISYMTIECIRAASILKKEGIEVEVIDVRTIKPLDIPTIRRSVSKTGRLIVADTGVKSGGVAGEIIASVVEYADLTPILSYKERKIKIRRITCPDVPTPTSWKLAQHYYPNHLDIAAQAMEMMERSRESIRSVLQKNQPSSEVRFDVPDSSFTGPF